MEQCLHSLRVLIDDRIRLLKSNKYLANADWHFIARSFRLINPHPKRSLLANDQRQIEDLVDQARIRLMNIQKVRPTRRSDRGRERMCLCLL